MEHSELIAYARDHDEMQIVYGVRKSGTEAFKLRTGIVEAPPGGADPKIVVSSRFNLKDVVSNTTADDLYVDFPAAGYEYCNCMSMVRYVSNAATNETQATLQDLQTELKHHIDAARVMSEKMREYEKELADLRKKKAATPPPKQSPAHAVVAGEDLAEALKGLLQSQNVLLERLAPEKKEEEKELGAWDPTDVCTWQGILSSDQELGVALDRLEMKLRFEYGVVGDSATQAQKDALRSLLLWSRNAMQTEEWWSNDMAVHGQTLLDELRLEHAKARGLDKWAILRSRTVKERKGKHDHLGAAIAEADRGRGRGRASRGGRGGRGGFTPICYECRERGHTRPNCPQLRHDGGRRSTSSNRDGGRQPQANRL